MNELLSTGKLFDSGSQDAVAAWTSRANRRQNSSFVFVFTSLVTDERTDGRTDGQVENIMPPPTSVSS